MLRYVPNLNVLFGWENNLICPDRLRNLDRVDGRQNEGQTGSFSKPDWCFVHGRCDHFALARAVRLRNERTYRRMESTTKECAMALHNAGKEAVETFLT
jgi:hypothetical protein